MVDPSAPLSPSVSAAWMAEIVVEVRAAVEAALDKKKLQQIHDQIESAHEYLDSFGLELDAQQYHTRAVEEFVQASEQEQGQFRQHIKMLEQKVDNLKNRSGRNNLHLVGLLESVKEAELLDFLEILFAQFLHLEQHLGSLKIERAHRLGVQWHGETDCPLVVLNFAHKQATYYRYLHTGKILEYNNREVLCFQDYLAVVEEQGKAFVPLCSERHARKIQYAENYI